jgi:hypothetical protein
MTSSTRAAALAATNAVLQSSSHPTAVLPLAAASSLLTTLSAVSASSRTEAARNTSGLVDVPVSTIVTAVELISDQLTAHAELGEAPVVVTSADIQVRLYALRCYAHDSMCDSCVMSIMLMAPGDLVPCGRGSA